MNGAAPILAFYGDDFTGSTDALESLSRAGARTLLFLEPPTPAQLARFPGLDAIGVAGLTRSLPTGAMEAALRPAFAALRALGVPFVHYKVCSTFDSSPEVGSIGRALELGREIFGSPVVPVIVGAPALGRHCVFGNLFARYGTAAAGALHRLDRHPSMSRHPVTPADEADLLRHLARQTDRPMALLDILALRGGYESARRRLDELLSRRPEIVFFDLLDEGQLPVLGALLESLGAPGRCLFAVGSSGVGMALGAHWSARGTFSPRMEWPAPGPAAPLLVLSGSASPVTAGQIEAAVAAGFVEIALDTADLLAGGHLSDRRVLDALQRGRSVVAHTCRGPDDPRLARPPSEKVDTASRLGRALGRLGRAAVAAGLTRRLVFTGGDSSSHAARALGLEAVEMLAPLAPGAPLCRAFAPDRALDGLEVNFKGGQVGAPDYFLTAARPPPLSS
jgi:3-oxoisoapionate kinase